MPSALETLVKILKLERSQGCKNNAVIGGMAAYAQNWEDAARRQARNADQHVLVDELKALLNRYEVLESKNERLNTVSYMLDRITGRLPAPAEYQARLAHYEQQEAAAPAPDAPPTGGTEASTGSDGKKLERPEKSEKRQKQKERERDKDRNQEREPRHSERNADRNPEKEASRERQPKGAPAAEASRPPRKEKSRGGGNPQHSQKSHGHHGDSSESNDAVFEPGDSIEATYTGQRDIPLEPRLARAPRKPRKPMDQAEAADIMRGLNAPVMTVRGVGPRLAQSLKKLGIETLNDLLFFLPRRYDDYTRLQQISKLMPTQKATVIGTVRHAELQVGRNNRKDFFMEVDDGTGALTVIFFGQHFLTRQIRVGIQVVLSGTVTLFNGRKRLINPEWEKLDAENLHTVGIVPIYPLTEGLSARILRRLMHDTVTYWAERLPDYVPEATLDRAELADLGWAIQNLHFPEGQDHLEHARNRFIFDQLLLLQMSILANRREWQSVPGIPLTVTDGFIEGLIAAIFPYPLTGAQRRAIDDIRRDVSHAVPMNRLLQGDVGAGKTAVAVAVLSMAFENGKQAALMAPTSILAEQHYRGLSATLANVPGERQPVVRLLTGAVSSAERESVYQGLADGSIDVVIGTHALIQDGVNFRDLAVVVIDEQHRFGVEQRGALRGKGTNPHVLVMTATPIPRTLALTMYADLDLSVMDEMPPGRIPIRTRIVQPVERERIYSFIESQLKEGRQAFIVHPLVEASEKIDAASALEAYDQLKGVFSHYQVGLLHGRMKAAEKDQIMADFSAGKFDILVTTSVAEVGVDVPNASVIVIEGANRFGLAQLHQFRGRVGRGQHASYCLLIPDTQTPEALERLEALEQTTDGFKLAEIDWKLRGAGDLVGTRQSGRSELQLMEAMTPQLVELAQREARTIYEEDPDLSQYPLLAQRVNMLYHPESDLS